MTRELHTQSESDAALRASLLRVLELATFNVLDVEEVNRRRPAHPPLDCEADRVAIAGATAALAALNRGDRQTFVACASRLGPAYRKGVRR